MEYLVYSMDIKLKSFILLEMIVGAFVIYAFIAMSTGN